MGGGVRVIFRDDFDGERLSGYWRRTQGNYRLEEGTLLCQQTPNMNPCVYQRSISEREGGLLLFQFVPGWTAFYVNNAVDEGLPEFRDWSLQGTWSAWSVTANRGINVIQSPPQPTLQSETWYYLLFRVMEDGRFSVYVWERDHPERYVLRAVTLSADDGWNDQLWTFGVEVHSGAIRIDSFEELLFPMDYEIPSVPPGALITAAVRTATPVPTRTLRPTRTPTATPLPVVDLAGERVIFYDEFDRSFLGEMYEQWPREAWAVANGLVSGQVPTRVENGVVHFRFADTLERYTLYMRFRFIGEIPESDNHAWFWTHQTECGQGYIFHLHNGVFLTGNPCSRNPQAEWHMLDQNRRFRWQANHWYDFYLIIDAPHLALVLDGETILENTAPLPFDPLRGGALAFGIPPGHRIEIDRVIIGAPETIGRVETGRLSCIDCPIGVLRTSLGSEVITESGLHTGDRVLIGLNERVVEAVLVSRRPMPDLPPYQPVVVWVSGQPLGIAFNNSRETGDFFQAAQIDSVILIMPAETRQ
jgi:hypothetical protein